MNRRRRAGSQKIKKLNESKKKRSGIDRRSTKRRERESAVESASVGASGKVPSIAGLRIAPLDS